MVKYKFALMMFKRECEVSSLVLVNVNREVYTNLRNTFINQQVLYRTYNKLENKIDNKIEHFQLSSI